MNTNQFFASSNSMNGFQSYFSEIYDPIKLKRIYIVKGGPGTGKSSMIRRIGEHFEATHKCEYFLCSSDPESLDGVIIGEKIAIIDGTSPHSTEAKYPVATEILVDNASGIRTEISIRKKEIIKLSKEKSKYYKYAYAYLKAAGEIKAEHLSKLYGKIDKEKLSSAIDRYFKQNFNKGESYTESVRLTEGITPIGYFKTSSFENNAKRKAVIINGKGYEKIIYDAILQKAKEYKLCTAISYDPLIPYSPNGLYFQNNSVCVVKYSDETHGDIDYDKYKVLNFERFIDKIDFNELKSKIKFADKCIHNLMQEAILNLSAAKEIHKKLESIYLEYTDFSAIDKNIYEITSDIASLV